MDSAAPIVEHFSQLGIVAEELLTAEQQVVDLDRRRNKNREALGAIRRSEVCSSKVWMCHGDFFIKTGIGDAKNDLESEQKTLDAEISRLREEVKLKASEVAKMEQREDQAADFINLKAL